MNFYRSPKRSMSDSHNQFNECPRCGEHSFEYLSSYAHCTNCLHFSDFEAGVLPLEYPASLDREFKLSGRKKFR